MRKEHSAGAVIYNPKTKEYLLLEHSHKRVYWSFPKGKIERNETEEQAAIREIKEETNLDVAFQPGFKETVEYKYTEVKTVVDKKITFFLAFTDSKDVKISFEHTNFIWLNYNDAMKKINFKDTKDLLKKANEAVK